MHMLCIFEYHLDNKEMRRHIKLCQDPKFSVFQEYFSSPSTYQKTSDVTIYCEDGLYFAHKLVLSSASNLLMTLLLECSSDKSVSLILPDFSIAEVSMFLNSLYGRKGSESFPELERVFGFTQTFEMKSEVAYNKEDPSGEILLNGDIQETSSQAESTYLIDEGSDNVGEEQEKRIEELQETDESCNLAPEPETLSEHKKLKSPIWKHFVRSSLDKTLLSCNYCNKSFSSTNGATSGAKRHVLTYHQDLLTELQLLDFTKNGPLPSTSKFKKSLVWKHFEKIPELKKAQCNYCGVYLSVYNGTTSSLRSHLISVHDGKLDN